MKYSVAVFRPGKDNYPANNHHVFFTKMDAMFSHFFDVHIVDYPCNYNEILDKLTPDFSLFQFNAFQTNLVENARNNDSIPKIGLGIVDSSDVKRGVYYRLLKDIGVDYFLFVGTSVGGLFPELKDQLFYLPHFIDAEMNRDYKLEKNIPVLLTGNLSAPFYSWRAHVKDPVLKAFPTLWYRHPGYRHSDSIPEHLRVQGESYFKAINASHVVPTCGSFKKTLIMKHLEIPGSRACLVCEENETVKMHGFRDMENCVFAEPEEITDKLQYLFEHPEELQRITDNGFNLVHGNHTERHRPQLLQLYELLKKKKPGQKIIQPSILEDLELEEEDSPRETIHLKVSDEIGWIRQIDRDISQRNYARAERECKRIIGISHYINDAKLRLCLIHMLNGRLNHAAEVLRTLISTGALYPVVMDPIDHALLILHYLTEDNIDKALYYSRVGISTRRRETDYIRLLAFRIAGEQKWSDCLVDAIGRSSGKDDIRSIYYFYAEEFELDQVLGSISMKNIGHSPEDPVERGSPEQSRDAEGVLRTEEIEIAYDREMLQSDLRKMNRDIGRRDRIKRKIQNGINSVIHFW